MCKYYCNHKPLVGVYNSNFSSEPTSATHGTTLGVQLKAPLNFNYSAIESGNVKIVSSNGDTEKLQVTETSISSLLFRNTTTVQNAARQDQDGILHRFAHFAAAQINKS